jgi:hypothetical protein
MYYAIYTFKFLTYTKLSQKKKPAEEAIDIAQKVKNFMTGNPAKISVQQKVIIFNTYCIRLGDT